MSDKERAHCRIAGHNYEDKYYVVSDFNDELSIGYIHPTCTRCGHKYIVPREKFKGVEVSFKETEDI